MYLLQTLPGFWQKIDAWDKWLFTKINSSGTNPVFDAVMPYLRNSVYWAPLYIFLLVFITLNYKTKGWWWVLLFICTLAITDLIGARVFKDGFERLRPCSDPNFSSQVRLLLNHCSGGYSFTSNHAANHFGMAAFFFVTFRHIFKKWGSLAFLWAAAIGYAQVYVGVHYPLDVAGGAALGIITGLCTGMLYHRFFGFIDSERQLTG
jgi:membrane-associated phospholipid phosphatase